MGRAEGLACADPGARNPIGVSENFVHLVLPSLRNKLKLMLEKNAMFLVVHAKRSFPSAHIYIGMGH